MPCGRDPPCSLAARQRLASHLASGGARQCRCGVIASGISFQAIWLGRARPRPLLVCVAGSAGEAASCFAGGPAGAVTSRPSAGRRGERSAAAGGNDWAGDRAERRAAAKAARARRRAGLPPGPGYPVGAMPHHSRAAGATPCSRTYPAESEQPPRQPGTPACRRSATARSCPALASIRRTRGIAADRSETCVRVLITGRCRQPAPPRLATSPHEVCAAGHAAQPRHRRTRRVARRASARREQANSWPSARTRASNARCHRPDATTVGASLEKNGTA